MILCTYYAFVSTLFLEFLWWDWQGEGEENVRHEVTSLGGAIEQVVDSCVKRRGMHLWRGRRCFETHRAWLHKCQGQSLSLLWHDRKSGSGVFCDTSNGYRKQGLLYRPFCYVLWRPRWVVWCAVFWSRTVPSIRMPLACIHMHMWSPSCPGNHTQIQPML